MKSGLAGVTAPPARRPPYRSDRELGEVREVQREHVAAAEPAGGEAGGHPLDAAGELAVGDRPPLAPSMTAGRPARRPAWRSTNETRSRSGTSGSGHGLRTTRSSTDGGCSRSDDMTRPPEVLYEPFGSNDPTIRYYSHHVNRTAARTDLLPRARDRRHARPVHALRPQALRPAHRRELLALSPHAALRRARAPRRGRPARGDARGDRPAAAPLHDHHGRQPAARRVAQRTRDAARRSTATSGC